MTNFAEMAEEYLAVRRAVGFTLQQPGRDVPRFAAFLDGQGATTITTALALTWSGTEGPAAMRLANVRIFARYVAAFDPATEVPPSGLLPVRKHRLVPYLYGDDEIAALMHERDCSVLNSGPPPARASSDFCGRPTAGGRSARTSTWRRVVRRTAADGVADQVREEPTCATQPKHAEALTTYDEHRQRCWPTPRTDRFFVAKRGGPVPYLALRDEWLQLLQQTGVPYRVAAQRPRLHDLRHSFTVRTLLGWYRDGQDVGALLPRLSTYLGHVEPASTYWYLSAAPELMALAAERLEQDEKGLS